MATSGRSSRQASLRKRFATQAACEVLETRRLMASYAIADYFPMAGGNEWTFTGSQSMTFLGYSESLSGTVVRQSTAVTDRGVPATRFTDTAYPDGFASESHDFVYSLDATGFYLHSSANSLVALEYEAPHRLLPAVASDGYVTSWSGVPTDVVTDQASYYGTSNGRCTVVGTQQVTSGIGTFPALKIVMDHTNRGTGSADYQGVDVTFSMNMRLIETVWMVRGVGIVKATADISGSVSAMGYSLPLGLDSSFTLTSTSLPLPSVDPVAPGSFAAGQPLVWSDTDNDTVTFRLSGGGTGVLDSSGVITLSDTTPRSVLTISVRPGLGGDGVYHLNGINCSGPLGSISGGAVVLEGDVNLGSAVAAGTSFTSMRFQRIEDADLHLGNVGLRSLSVLQWLDQDGTADVLEAASVGVVRVSGRRDNVRTVSENEFLAGDFEADILTGTLRSLSAAGAVQSTVTVAGAIGGISAGSLSGSIRAGADAWGRSLSTLSVRQDVEDLDLRVDGTIGSIQVRGAVFDSRIQARSGIRAMKVTSLLGSEVLVGVDRSFSDEVITRSAVSNPAARLGSLSVTGRSLPVGQSHPAYVSESHISAPYVGTVSLKNVAVEAGPVVQVLNDAGVLRVSQTPLTMEAVFASGTWRTPGNRPEVWEVV